MNIIIALFVLIILIIYTIEDIKNKNINIIILFIGILITTFVELYIEDTSPIDMAVACIPGLCMLLVSKFASGSVGFGDGLIICFTGLSTGLWINISILIFSFIYLSLFCAFGLILGKLKRKQSVPFVPFILIGFITTIFLII